MDPRTTLCRPDLAPEDCEGVTKADAYGEVRTAWCKAAVASLRAAPDGRSEQVSQLLLGERFDLLRREDGFAWGQGRRDGYVGWVEASALSTEPAEPTHRVVAPRAVILGRPEIRAPSVSFLGMNALVQAGSASGAFTHIEGLGWVATRQLSPIGSDFHDPADIAAMFVGVPYIWGARDGLGLDCSGLVQQAMFAAGLRCPRDADQQAGLGEELSKDSLGRGDLVAWRGHIGMMLDAERLIHANAHHMAVAIEPVETAIARIAATATGLPTAFRRLDHGLSRPRFCLGRSDTGLSAPLGRTVSPPTFL